MENAINAYINSLQIQECQSFLNLQCFPIVADKESNIDYLTLDEALSLGLISVTEVDSSGSVPELVVKNKSDRKILILDGEELVGAKQNRIVNTTILFAEKSSQVIPVSCVEQDRWTYTSQEFSSKSRAMPSFMRAKKARKVHESVRRSGKFTADQHEIWDDINQFSSRMDAASPSMEMGAIFDEKRDEIKDYAEKFRTVPGQVGGVFAINGNIVGLDSFGKSDTFAKLHEKLVESYVLDALDRRHRSTDKKASTDSVVALLGSIRKASIEVNNGVSLGTDVRISNRDLNGFALVYEDEPVHLSVFAQEAEQHAYREHTRMHRFSSRRRNRTQ